MSAFEVRFMMHLLDLGIIPFCENAQDFRQALSKLPAQERRAVKRKFRKLWRNIARKEEKALSKNRPEGIEPIFSRLSTKGSAPTARQKRWRQESVLKRAKFAIQTRNENF